MIQRDLWQKYDRASIFPNQSISFKIETSRLCTSPDQTLICERCPLFCAKYGSWNSYEVVLAVLFFGRKKSRSQKSRFLFCFLPSHITFLYRLFPSRFKSIFAPYVSLIHLRAYVDMVRVCFIYVTSRLTLPQRTIFLMSKKCEKYFTLISKLKSFFVEH